MSDKNDPILCAVREKKKEKKGPNLVAFAQFELPFGKSINDLPLSSMQIGSSGDNNEMCGLYRSGSTPTTPAPWGLIFETMCERTHA